MSNKIHTYKKTTTYLKVGDEILEEVHSIQSIRAEEMPEPYEGYGGKGVTKESMGNETPKELEDRRKAYTRFGEAVFADYPNDPCFRCIYNDCIWDEGGKSAGCEWRINEVRDAASKGKGKKGNP